MISVECKNGKWREARVLGDNFAVRSDIGRPGAAENATQPAM
jgi:hypothetical protein